MKLSSLILLTLTVYSFALHIPRVPLTRESTPAAHFLMPYLGDPDHLELKGYPYVVLATFREDHPDELPMAVALHTSKTFLANCRYFKTFDCSLYPENCLTFPSMPFHMEYPFYSLSGVMMDLKFSIANYVRTRPASIYYATTCTNSRFHTNQVAGVVGLSINEANYHNIETQDNQYSLFLNDDDSGGELIFGKDLSHAVNADENLTILTNYDWEMIIHKIRFGNRNHLYPSDAIFDMVAPFIGIPNMIYEQILEELEENFLLRCQHDVVMPECLYPDDISLLPNLTLTFANSVLNYQNLNLGPELYLKKIRDNRYQLLLAGLAIDPHDKGMIHVTPSYVNYTILGHPFMKHFYVVFNYENLQVPQVTLYEALQAVNTDSGTSTGIAIGAILLGILVIGALGACLWAINQSRKKANEDVRKEMVYGHPVTKVDKIERPVVVDRPLVTEIREPLVRPNSQLVAT